MRSAVFALGLLAVSAVYADGSIGTSKHHVATAAASQRVFIDPLTKRPRAPTADELQAEPANVAPAADAKSAVTPRTVTLPDGTVGFYPGKTKNHLVAHRGKDGRITTICADAPAKKAQP